MMSRIEKRLCVLALVFVIIYLGAVALSIQSRIEKKDDAIKIESAGAAPGEEHLMLAELLLPMLILLTVTICFIIVKKKREKARKFLDSSKASSQSIPSFHGKSLK